MERIQLESINFPGYFIRHRYALGELTRRDGPAEDFWFTLERRGSEHQREIVALQSFNFPDRFLRHRDFRMRLESPDGPDDELFLQDSSFVVVSGLADPDGISFRSVNFPDRFIRHREYHLYLEPDDTPSLAGDATFLRTPAPVPVE